jgi:hypothetical protein
MKIRVRKYKFLRRLIYRIIAVTAVSLLYSGAKAQPKQDVSVTKPESETSDIVVIGSSSNFKLSGKSLKNMVEAFSNGRQEFAPDSRLIFRVQSTNGTALNDVSLSLQINEEMIDLVVDKDGLFSLPLLNGKPRNIKLISNRSKTAIQIKPLVYSSTFTPYSRRMGDLRLECRVLWAGYKSSISIFLQAGFGVAGGCNSSDIGIYFSAPAPLKSIMIDNLNYDRPGTLRLDGLKYRPPIFDKKIGNDAVLTLTAIN